MKCNYRVPGTSARIIIEESDLLDKNCLRVIHSSSTFDTNCEIVNPNSLIGKFISANKDKMNDIDFQIDNWTNHIQSKGEFLQELRYRRTRFPKGTICPIVVDNREYCLAAFCDSSLQHHSEHVSVNDFIDYWNGLWSSLMDLAISKKEIAVVVPGGNVLSVGTGYFTIEQKLGIVIHSFIQHLTNGCTVRSLNICLSEEDACLIDFKAWEDVLIPFLFQMANVPIYLQGASEQIYLSNPARKQEDTLLAENSFSTDIKEIVSNLSSFNGRLFEQYDGNKKIQLVIDVKEKALLDFLEQLSTSNKLAWDYLSQRKGLRYDRNKLFQLIGLLQERSTYFGDLNRKSVIVLGLACTNDAISSRWNYLGDDIDNIVSYVGQRLADMKRVHKSIYEQIVDAIPEAHKR